MKNSLCPLLIINARLVNFELFSLRQLEERIYGPTVPTSLLVGYTEPRASTQLTPNPSTDAQRCSTEFV